MVMKNPQVLIVLMFFINPSAFLCAHAVKRYFSVNFLGESIEKFLMRFFFAI